MWGVGREGKGSRRPPILTLGGHGGPMMYPAWRGASNVYNSAYSALRHPAQVSLVPMMLLPDYTLFAFCLHTRRYFPLYWESRESALDQAPTRVAAFLCTCTVFGQPLLSASSETF